LLQWRSEELRSGWQARGGAGIGEGGAVGGGQDSGGAAPHSGKQEEREEDGPHMRRVVERTMEGPTHPWFRGRTTEGQNHAGDVALRAFVCCESQRY
jgi:hypothetical protein